MVASLCAVQVVAMRVSFCPNSGRSFRVRHCLNTLAWKSHRAAQHAALFLEGKFNNLQGSSCL